jgi:hypothetical protein
LLGVFALASGTKFLWRPFVLLVEGQTCAASPAFAQDVARCRVVAALLNACHACCFGGGVNACAASMALWLTFGGGPAFLL